MIKNIIFDVGGILFDGRLKNIEKLLHKDCKNIYKKAYGGNFKKLFIRGNFCSTTYRAVKNGKRI